MPKLTAKSVEQTKPNSHKRQEIPDALLTGLYLVVQPSGSKSWAVRYRHAGRPRKLTIGRYPALDLASAREEAKLAMQTVAGGRDPAFHKSHKRQQANDQRNLVKNVAAEFIQRHVRQKRSGHELERMLNRDVLPAWGGRLIHDISKRDVIELMDGLTDRGIGPMANRVFAVGRKMFNWAKGRDIIEVSPFTGLRPPVSERSRDRVLNDDELRWLWKAAEEAGYPFGDLTQLLLLTLQRRGEVACATASEIDVANRIWVIPRHRSKNDRANEVPLSDTALAVVEAMPRIAGESGFLFTTTGDSPISGFSRAKNSLDRAMLEIARQEAIERNRDPDEVKISDWQFHDLRRTGTSGMARLGVAPHIVEAILNHKSGTVSGVAAVYNRYDYAAEKRAALDSWSQFVTRVVTRTADGI